jgi:hypothetical protein
MRLGGVSNDRAYSLAVDAAGGPVITGAYFGGTINLGGSNLVATGGEEIFLAKYNAAGVHQWSRRCGGTSDDIGNGVSVTKSGDVYLAGYFSVTAEFGGANLVSAGSSDVFVAKYNAAGVHQWSYGFGGTGQDLGISMVADGNRGAVVTGYFVGTANFGGNNLVSAGGADIFIAKYDATGAHEWSRGFGSATIDVGYGIAVNGPGNVLFTGTYNGTVDFGAGNLVSAGNSDVFLGNYFTGTGLNIDSIADIGNDQGRKVKIRFDRSHWDIGTVANPVTRYVAMRRDDAPPANSSSNLGVGEVAHRLVSGWTEVGSISAFGDDEYGIDVPTIGDSTLALGQYRSTFFIRAATDEPSVFYDSPPDSGYSKDNLAPGVPLNLIYNAGDLTWDESSAADFDFFTVYGANTDNFGAATVVDYSVSPTMSVNASPYAYYFVTATDFSGNEGKPAKVNALSGVGDVPKSYVLSVSNYPNPFNPRTTVSYTVPSRGHVTVRVFDAHGAYVATLFDGERNAGAYSTEWDGGTEKAGVAASGVYFARIEHASGTRSKKMVLLK